MYETNSLEGLLPEHVEENHLSTLNKSSIQQLKLSYKGSNIASNILLNDVWSTNNALFNEKAVSSILSSAKVLLQNADTSHSKTWRSCLNKLTDPETLFEKSLLTCTKCNNQDYKGLDIIHKTECKCDLKIIETKKKAGGPSTTLCSSKSLSERELSENTNVFFKNSNYDSSSQENQYVDEKYFKPKFARQRVVRNTDPKTMLQEPKIVQPEAQRFPEYKYTLEADIEKKIDLEEEENKAHKSNVAKITFKTAKEQLLASNPAAKRTLGASRKAQGKFVSPMIGAQDNKQETTEPTYTDERLKNLDPKMIELIESEIIDKGTPIGWDDIAGLQMAKSVIQEAVVWPLLRPDIFTGLRRPPKGILLFGPPGTGKTLIGKCVAAQCNATFFSISASSLTSKWIGDGEKMVRALFAVARCHQPAVIFIDEIDSLLTQRSDTEHEATRRIKTEFLVQFDGAATAEEDRILIVGATNRPQELDEAARRRLVKRLYIPLPDVEARQQIITNLLANENHSLSTEQIEHVGSLTEGYSGADMKSLCSEAAMGPLRALPLNQIATIHRDSVRPVCAQDFVNALQRVRPSVSQDDLGQYVKWNQTYGHGI